MDMADDQGEGESSWKMNHYILAGLCATLIVTAVITITSIVLNPGQVTFTVTHASRQILPSVTNLNVTVAVHNTSRRCQVRYQSVFIDLKNEESSSSTQALGTRSFYIRANNVPSNNTFPLDYVRGPHETLVSSTVHLVVAANASRRLKSDTILTVVVTAQVRFKIGVTPTRLYDIKVYCPDVNFTDTNNASTSPVANQLCTP